MAVQEGLYRWFLQRGEKTYIPAAIRDALLKLPTKERFREYERFQAAHFGDSQRLNFFGFELEGRYLHIDRAWYSELIKLPFEKRTIPAPVGYEPLLRELFGDYHKFVKFASDHGQGILFSPDVPYEEYYRALEEKSG